MADAPMRLPDWTRGTAAAAAVPAALVAASLATLWAFTAEDAYIVARYGENLVRHGRLHFNLGEPVNALTSPLHGLLTAALALAGPPVPVYKWVGAACLVASGALVARALRGHPWAQAGALLVVASPPLALWAVGGLETPLLMLWATALAVLAASGAGPTPRRTYAVAALAALAVLTRYDAVLFAGPLALGALVRLWQAGPRQRRHVWGAVALGAAPVLAWLGVAWWHYGDPLPTSFYVKPPGETAWTLNGWYVAQYLAFVGAAPLAALALLRWRRRRAVAVRVPVELAVALGVVGLYALTAATTHMMFGFRLGVPYVPALALVVGRALAATAPEGGGLWRQRLGWGAALALLAGFHVAHLRHFDERSINGFAVGLEQADAYRDAGATGQVGKTLLEYTREGAGVYSDRFMRSLASAAEDIEADWQARHGGTPPRPPRIWTFAAGVLPYSYPEAYVFEVLVSYRQACSLRYHKALAADYVHVFNDHGREERTLLPRWRPGRYERVATYTYDFDGRQTDFIVFHNTDPRPNPLPARIHDPCPPEAAWASPVFASDAAREAFEARVRASGGAVRPVGLAPAPAAAR